MLSSSPPRVIAFTTPQNYAQRLSHIIQLKNWTPLWCPTITVDITTKTISTIQTYIQSLQQFSAIAFTSRTGISAFEKALENLTTHPLPPNGDNKFIVAALGKDAELLDESFVAKLCENRGRIRTLIPQIATPSGLVDSIGSGEGKLVMCPVPVVTGIREPPVVPKFLSDLGNKGWVPVRVDAYETRWRFEGGEVGELVKKIEERKVDAIVFTSTGEVEGFLKSLRVLNLDWVTVMRMCPGMAAAAHGPVTAAGAAEFGVGIDVVSSKFESFDGVVEALECWWKG